MRIILTIAVSLGTALIAPVSAMADGFSTPHTLPFKLNGPGMAISKESLRASMDAAARANGSAAASQANSNMANVIQVTENYDIVLNGNNNQLNTAGSKVDGAQDGAGSSQSAANQVQANTDSNIFTSLSGDAMTGKIVLNP